MRHGEGRTCSGVLARQVLSKSQAGLEAAVVPPGLFTDGRAIRQLPWELSALRVCRGAPQQRHIPQATCRFELDTELELAWLLDQAYVVTASIVMAYTVMAELAAQLELA